MSQALRSPNVAGMTKPIAATVLMWFSLAFAGSLLGAFDSQLRPPIPLGLATVLPVALFGLCYLESAAMRQFVSSLDLRMLTFAQTWRVGGIVFLVLYHRGLLPAIFAIPAGYGDIAVGITAPMVAWYWKPPFPKKAFLVWNVLGLLDLAAAVTLGILASATPAGVLAGDVTTRLMSELPLSLIPTFFVPLLVILHLICLIRARTETFSSVPVTSARAQTR